MNLLKVESDQSFGRDPRTGAIVNTNVSEFQAAMERKAAREEYLNDLHVKMSQNEEKIKYLTELVEKFITREQHATNSP